MQYHKTMTMLILCTTLAILAPSLVLGFSSGDEPPVLPDDLLSLLPTEAHLLAACASREALDRELIYLLADPLQYDSSPPALADMLSGALPDAAEWVDGNRPMAVVLTLPPFMTQNEPLITLIVPRSGDLDAAALLAGSDFNTSADRGDYVAFSTDPAYQPSESVPELALDFPLKLAAMRLDLEQIVKSLSPVIEMGLGGLLMSASMSDQSAGDVTSGASPRQSAVESMTADEAAALVEMLRALLDSVDGLEMDLDKTDDQLTAGMDLTVLPDSPLAPSPQPSFAEALELTRMLPDGAQLLQVSAVNKVKEFERMMKFYRLNMQREAAKLMPEQAEAFVGWFERYLEAVTLFFQPWAAAISIDEDGISGNMVLKSDDAGADQNQWSDVMNTYPDLGVGVTVEPAETVAVAGRTVHAWQIVVDQEQMQALHEQSGDIRTNGVEQMTQMLSSIVPNVYMCAKDDYLFTSAARNSDQIEAVIKASGQRRVAVDPRVARAAADAGEHCQQVVVGDLHALLGWFVKIMEEVAPDHQQIAWPEGAEMPFVQTFCIDSTHYDVEFTTPARAAQQMIRTLRSWE